MKKFKQVTLAEVYCDCAEAFENDKYRFLALLEEHIDIGVLIPQTFYNHFYAWTGRPRSYPLEGFIWAFLLQRIFSIPTESLLIIFLKYSRELREFCGFTKVPDASKFTRFKQDFLSDLQAMFDRLVDITEPLCQAIDAEKAAMTIFDTSGIEAWVKENNPKFADRIIKQLKSFAKVKGLDSSFDPYKAAYGSMPSSAEANPEIKQLYINGHFCYVYKFGLVTNGLGIVRHISFYNKDFFDAHPEIEIQKKSDSPGCMGEQSAKRMTSPNEDKSVGDARLLIPTLDDFFKAHPLINPKTFLGDAAFDAAHLYKALLSGDTFGTNRHFQRAFIPLNHRSGLENPDYTIDENGIPCCPNDPNLPMKPENSTIIKNGVSRFKFVCPKMKWVKCEDGKYRRRTLCTHPCTSSLCGRMVYLYPEQNLRATPGAVRGTVDWNDTYKIRTAAERTINHFKSSFCIAGRRTQNAKTLHADLLLSGITQLITVILADKIRKPQLLRSIKSLAA
jgi:hypothetical protein